MELFAAEAATLIITARSILSVVSRYGCFKRLRSDRGTHFVNEVIEIFLRLFEIQRALILTIQANGIVERLRGEEMRHLKTLIAAKDLKII